MSLVRRHAATLALVGTLALAAASGYLASKAIGAASQGAVTTTTVTLTNGGRGPTGPTGPAGPPASAACPAGYVEADLVVVHPSGHVTIRTCVKSA